MCVTQLWGPSDINVDIVVDKANETSYVKKLLTRDKFPFHFKSHEKKTKAFHDKRRICKHFALGNKVLEYDPRHHSFLGKLRFHWTSPFVVRRIYPHDAEDIGNPKDEKGFKENGQRFKPPLEGFDLSLKSIDLANPIHGIG